MTNAQPVSILIVDDVPANLQLLAGMLKEHGYKVRPAPSGALALEAARRAPPDLILLDITMPEMSGFEVCRRLKADPDLADIPVLFISALGDAADKVRAFGEGGQDYITKPFQVEEVLARVRTHLSLRRAQHALEEQNRALREALEQLKKAQNQLIVSEKMAALGVLAAGVAHEINNPLNFVKTSCHGLENDFRDLIALVDFCRNAMIEEQRTALEAYENQIDYSTLTREVPELFAHIFEGLWRAEDIVGCLRVFSRTDEAISSDINLNEVVDSVLVMLHNRYKKSVEIVKNIGELPLISGNYGKLSQVVVNILNNAIDSVEAMEDPTRRRITLSTETSQRDGKTFATLRITDAGLGIAPDVRRRIFDPFYTTKPVGQGTGLGLFICSNLVSEHHGFLEVASTVGAGSTFSIFLPEKQKESI